MRMREPGRASQCPCGDDGQAVVAPKERTIADDEDDEVLKGIDSMIEFPRARQRRQRAHESRVQLFLFFSQCIAQLRQLCGYCCVPTTQRRASLLELGQERVDALVRCAVRDDLRRGRLDAQWRRYCCVRHASCAPEKVGRWREGWPMAAHRFWRGGKGEWLPGRACWTALVEAASKEFSRAWAATSAKR